jgi:hypothetical protein
MRIISNFVDYYDCCQKNGINRELVMKIEFEVLINSNFGGFSIPNEIVLWLHKNKGWELPAKNGKDNSKFSSMYNNESYLKDKSIKNKKRSLVRIVFLIYFYFTKLRSQTPVIVRALLS